MSLEWTTLVLNCECSSYDMRVRNSHVDMKRIDEL